MRFSHERSGGFSPILTVRGYQPPFTVDSTPGELDAFAERVLRREKSWRVCAMAQEITARELAQHLENGHSIRLIDVRQPWENGLAKLPDSVLIPLNELPHRAAEIPKEPGMLVVVYCHHGIRSLSAVSYLQRLGFNQVRSLAGGIDAWSCEVDSTIARY